jgi:hypothetical protein
LLAEAAAVGLVLVEEVEHNLLLMQVLVLVEDIQLPLHLMQEEH